ncbi:MAG TPA: cysteine--tRNA ligase [Polyangia bacterium]|jgi:cysteinyl-tRNA synthetase|nr:cysteine--tRNA ligase [Polyangia bacterium]
MALRIYDTRAGKKVPFEPLTPGRVGMYSCGITVYDLCHVGHARMMVAFDVIARHLRASGLTVTFVRNVTDVDDKIIRKAEAEKRTAAEVAHHYTAEMNIDLRGLGVLAADHEPNATEHIAEVIEIIGKLEERGLAYAAAGDVYYAVAGFAHYGQLSKQHIDDLRSGARIEIDEHKKSPLDFALWKGVKPGEPFWPSPWGDGRPGWHIECSAMAHRYLGEPFDIHGGGADLIFPHHENEIAQSEGAFGDGQFARHWIHSGMVNFGGEKMSKSLGNFVTIRKVGETYDLEALRLHLIGVHYRSPVAFTIAHDDKGHARYPEIDEAEARLAYYYRTLERLAAAPGEDDGGAVVSPADQTISAFREAMDDDFNTAAAIGHLSDAFLLANKLLDEPAAAAKDVRRRTLARLRKDLAACGATLGIFQRPPSAFLDAYRLRLCARRGIEPAAVEARIGERAAARKAKDFASGDAIRRTLQELGVELMDTPAGTTWRVTEPR